MSLAERLAEKETEIVNLWVERTLDSYNSPGFFKSAQNQFDNPVGAMVRKGLAELFVLLRKKGATEDIARTLDQVVRKRAAQVFTPSQAVIPFLELKWVIRNVLGEARHSPELIYELENFECEVERMALLAFDMFAVCREQLFNNRLREIKSGRAQFVDGGCPSRLFETDDKGPVTIKK